MSNQKERRYAINYVLALAESTSGESLYPNKHNHVGDQKRFAAEYHRDRQLYLVREMLKGLKI